MDIDQRINLLLLAMDKMHQQNKERDVLVDKLIEAHRLGEERLSRIEVGVDELRQIVTTYIKGVQNGKGN